MSNLEREIGSNVNPEGETEGGIDADVTTPRNDQTNHESVGDDPTDDEGNNARVDAPEEPTSQADQSSQGGTVTGPDVDVTVDTGDVES